MRMSMGRPMSPTSGVSSSISNTLLAEVRNREMLLGTEVIQTSGA